MARGLLLALCLIVAGVAHAAEGEHPRDIHYVTAPPAPAIQSQAQASMKSMGCLTCHTKTDEPTMHVNPAVILGCTDCHGGDAQVARPDQPPAPVPLVRAERVLVARAPRDEPVHVTEQVFRTVRIGLVVAAGIVRVLACGRIQQARILHDGLIRSVAAADPQLVRPLLVPR